jgi:gliding motility-associated-like protein
MFFRNTLLVQVLLSTWFSSFAQIDNVGAGHCLHLDGAYDYVEMQSDYSTLKMPLTISAWINANPNNHKNALVLFSSNDNNPLYHGFYLSIAHGQIWCEYGDNQGGADISYRNGKRASVPDFYGKWTHVAAVMTSETQFELYINGINVGGNFSGSSTEDMYPPYPGDKAKAGYLLSNGVTYYFDGEMDELTLWSKALTETEIRNNMCRKLSGNEGDLISHWSFDETSGSTTYDNAKKISNGLLKGNPARLLSGAPVGDVSFNIYLPGIGTESLTVYNDDAHHDQIDVTSLNSHVVGVHVYEVKESPSSTAGLMAPVPDHYFGVFLVGDNPTSGLHAEVSYVENQIKVCASTRTNNSIATWDDTPLTTSVEDQQVELIRQRVPDPGLTVDLGPDRAVCKNTVINSGFDPANTNISWSNGLNTSYIIVTAPGEYSVKVMRGCYVAADTVALQITPVDQVDLGPDVTVCDKESYTIKSGFSSTDHTFQWSNNATTSNVTVTTSGTYSVTVIGACDSSNDAVTVDIMKAPPAFTIGSDQDYCIMPLILLKAPLNDKGFQFEWQDGSASSSFNVRDFGIYALTVKNECGESTDSVTYSKLDKTDLQQIPNVITPNGDIHNEFFVVPRPDYADISLLVLNRWGEQVYKSSNYKDDWNGNYLANGIYFFVVEGDCIVRTKGSLTIMR